MSPSDLAPVVDALLRPWSGQLGRSGVSAGVVLSVGTVLCVAAGIMVATAGAGPWLMPVQIGALLAWLATVRLGALLEREQQAGTPSLPVFRDLAEGCAEVALTWPLARVAGLEAWLVTLCCMLALLSEIAGLAGAGTAAGRRRDGPMDATARLGATGVLCVLLATGLAPGWWTAVWFQILPFLLGWTICRRLRAVWVATAAVAV